MCIMDNTTGGLGCESGPGSEISHFIGVDGPQTTVSGNIFFEAIHFLQKCDSSLLSETYVWHSGNRDVVGSSTIQFIGLIVLFSVLSPLLPQRLIISFLPRKKSASRKYGRRVLRANYFMCIFFLQ